jgi:hypothetical protein
MAGLFELRQGVFFSKSAALAVRRAGKPLWEMSDTKAAAHGGKKHRLCSAVALPASRRRRRAAGFAFAL